MNVQTWSSPDGNTRKNRRRVPGDDHPFASFAAFPSDSRREQEERRASGGACHRIQEKKEKSATLRIAEMPDVVDSRIGKFKGGKFRPPGRRPSPAGVVDGRWQPVEVFPFKPPLGGRVFR